jgi:hypothetical protein
VLYKADGVSQMWERARECTETNLIAAISWELGLGVKFVMCFDVPGMLGQGLGGTAVDSTPGAAIHYW